MFLYYVPLRVGSWLIVMLVQAEIYSGNTYGIIGWIIMMGIYRDIIFQ